MTVTLAMLAGLLLSWKLWLTDRLYPHVPIWDGLPIVPPPWDRILLVGLIFLLGLSLGLSRPRWGILVFAVPFAAWCLYDQTRWQPWVYQYLALLLALSFAGGADEQASEQALSTCRLMIAFTYMYSGLQKINVTFATDVHPWMIEPVLPWLPEAWRPWLQEQGWYPPLIEAGLGVALLFRPARLVAVLGLLGMHAIILYCLSPWGHDWNSVIWPWNVALMALLVLLFLRTPHVSAWQILWPRRFVFGYVALVLFAVMPALSFFDAWDAYLSASLYSGNTIEADLQIDDDTAELLPDEIRRSYLQFGELDLTDWAFNELNVPPYPARRVYRGIALAIGRQTGQPDGLRLSINERPHWRSGKRERTAVHLAFSPNTHKRPRSRDALDCASRRCASRSPSGNPSRGVFGAVWEP